MSYKIKISNTLNQEIRACYRMPRSEVSEDIKINPVLEVTIQPRALLNDIYFADQNYYHQWKLQNQSFFDRGILIEGEVVTEKQILANNEKVMQDNKKSQSDKVESQVNKLEEAAANINAAVHFEEVDETAKTKGRKSAFGRRG
ncbi:hypothetical protein FBF91_05865 [Campylobacter upsaliensis]|uniref:hypothetical protein n=1 Tax=Campylobacter upsaliensis TaxID=28080 RepID=UPI0012CFC1FA|nr:hypothetical protein [Campylobacter upsaliensis]EAK7296536.1 hypothetical protein [Campylobacter upsaliensis]MBJ6809582.1 hypothetical protein [Campylobacter upsaliensis]